MSKDQKETRDRILDTAESLFSDHGFENVSLRQITQEAGVNIASVNYHFGSKDGLITEVFTRVVAPINSERLERLAQAEVDHEPAPVPLEEILEALHRPVVNQLKQSELNESVYLKLAGRCLSESGDSFSENLAELFKEVISRFMAATCKTLPHINETDIFWRMHFSFGALVASLTDAERVNKFTQGRIQTQEPEEILQRLIGFTAAGMKADAGKADSTSASPTKKVGAATTALIALIGLSSCKATSPPDAKPFAAVKAPAHWVADGSYISPSVADRYWVHNFNDPNLNAFVAAVLENNKDLKAAQSRIEVTAANARIVGADRLPQIGADFGAQRNKQNFIGFPIAGSGGGPFNSYYNQFGVGLNMSWELDLWGRIKAGQQAVIANFEASEFERATAELSLTGQAVKAWFALAETRDQIALTRRTITRFEDTVDLLDGRFEQGIEENGRSFASELLLAESDVARAEENLSSELELAERTSRQLEVLAGRYPAGRAGDTARLPNSLPGPVPAGLPATLLDRRPDIAVAERQIAAADERLLEAKRTLLPAISLTGSLGTASDDIGDILDSNFSVWSIAAKAAQPVLQGGRLRANIDRREAEMDLAISNFEQAALVAFSEVENALAAEKYLKNRYRYLSEAAERTEQAYTRSLEEFNNGTGDILTVLSSQQQFFTTNSQKLYMRRLLLDNRVDLYLALGGSFRPHTTLSGDKATSS